jgi:uncharacterized RDD family membrane protein YckC
MSNDPFAEQPGDPLPGPGDPPPPRPGDPPPQWGQDPTPGVPPGAAAGIRAASVGKRVGAFIIDGIGLGIVLTILLAIVGIDSPYIRTIIMSIAGVAYFAAMEGSSGQTLAKKMFGIKVVAADGSPVTMQGALLRRLPFYVGGLLPGFLGALVSFGLLLALLITTIQEEPEHRGLHDKWADTKVIEV